MTSFCLQLVCLVLLAGVIMTKTIDYAKWYREAVKEYEKEQKDSGNGPILKSSMLLNDAMHFQVFKQNAKNVIKQNRKKKKKWTAKIYSFALETDYEFKQTHLGLNWAGQGNVTVPPIALMSLQAGSIPESIDYSNKLPPVKNQGGCGSCWAFGAMVALEYQVNKNRVSDRVPIALSEQQCLDCTSSGGCGGGWPTTCYNWGIYHYNHYTSAYDYRYEAKSALPCRSANYNSAIPGIKVDDYRYVSAGDENVLVAVADNQIGVLSCAIQVGPGFSSFSSGVFSSNECNKGVNHAVDIVGYGKLNGVPYWRVRNSWGVGWGDGGYINMKRGENGNNVNMCFLTQHAHYPVVSGSYSEAPVDYKNTCADGKQAMYRGTVHTTVGGKTCQNWDVQEPHDHASLTSEKLPYSGLDDNYCRNPDGEDTAWCYTTDKNTRWEHCQVDDCSLINWCRHENTEIDGDLAGAVVYDSLDAAKAVCYRDTYCTGITHTSGNWYLRTGKLSDNDNSVSWMKGVCKVFTPPATGEWCQYEHSYLSGYAPGYRKTTDLEYAKRMCVSGGASKCGGITKEGGVYTLRQGTTVKYSSSGEITWRKGLCNDYTDCADGDQNMYRGDVGTTKSGFTCQKWTEQSPHGHSRTPENYPNSGIGDHNYCRNPDGEPGAWCYTMNSSKRWELCDIPSC